jgi:hypothetical protein
MELSKRAESLLAVFKRGRLLSFDTQNDMRAVKSDLAELQERVLSSREMIRTFTEEEEELALLNLGMLRVNPSLYNYPLCPEILAAHDVMEELLENYLLEFNALDSKIVLLQKQIRSTEELVSTVVSCMPYLQRKAIIFAHLVCFSLYTVLFLLPGFVTLRYVSKRTSHCKHCTWRSGVRYCSR